VRDTERRGRYSIQMVKKTATIIPLGKPYAVSVPTVGKADFISALMNYGTLKSGSSDVGNNTITLYTVPKGKTFFLIEASLTWLTVNAGAGGYYLYYKLKDVITFGFQSPDPASLTGGLSVPFSIPVKLIGGQTIKIQGTNSNFVGLGSFIGYEIDDQQIPNFL